MNCNENGFKSCVSMTLFNFTRMRKMKKKEDKEVESEEEDGREMSF